ncbi:hypothetical protein IE53DRAFT_369889 [Violaceomyces palustris]|uniref:Uncharacterized protein n=1 Tax=Violaceomyces palustris TaxID=1673888 RepID=A0ACD0NTY9_9BASI|nr:hypothetical protein IE53DRAFT_369889 [Violaceomyces palustris]
MGDIDPDVLDGTEFGQHSNRALATANRTGLLKRTPPNRGFTAASGFRVLAGVLIAESDNIFNVLEDCTDLDNKRATPFECARTVVDFATGVMVTPLVEYMGDYGAFVWGVTKRHFNVFKRKSRTPKETDPTPQHDELKRQLRRHGPDACDDSGWIYTCDPGNIYALNNYEFKWSAEAFCSPAVSLSVQDIANQGNFIANLMAQNTNYAGVTYTSYFSNSLTVWYRATGEFRPPYTNYNECPFEPWGDEDGSWVCGQNPSWIDALLPILSAISSEPFEAESRKVEELLRCPKFKGCILCRIVLHLQKQYLVASQDRAKRMQRSSSLEIIAVRSADGFASKDERRKQEELALTIAKLLHVFQQCPPDNQISKQDGAQLSVERDVLKIQTSDDFVRLVFLGPDSFLAQVEAVRITEAWYDRHTKTVDLDLQGRGDVEKDLGG